MRVVLEVIAGFAYGTWKLGFLKGLALGLGMPVAIFALMLATSLVMQYVDFPGTAHESAGRQRIAHSALACAVLIGTSYVWFPVLLPLMVTCSVFELVGAFLHAKRIGVPRV